MKINTCRVLLYQALLAAALFLTGHPIQAQVNGFNCLTAGDQQWTAFFLGRDVGRITNGSPYTIKFSVSGKHYTLSPGESITGSWINENTSMENCESVTCDGFLLSDMRSAVHLQKESERFISNLSTPKSYVECDRQIKSVQAKLDEFRKWKTKTSPKFWEHIQGELYEKAWMGKIKGIEEVKKNLQKT